MEEFKGNTVMKGVLTGSRYTVLCIRLYTPEKGLFIKHKNQISRVSLVCTDIVIIILIASVDCG